jgi:hypothetical protein
MYRKEIEELTKWKASPNRKPLIIKGARQVGKTWLIKEFGKTTYEQVAYINFESSPVMRQVFDLDFDIQRILSAIRIETGIEVIPESTLIVLDEIQEAPKALTSLKYFAENAPEFHVIAAGSLLGILLSKGSSFPVGKVSFMELFPLPFSEFLTAIGQEQIAKAIQQKDWPMLTLFREKLINFLKQYYFTNRFPFARGYQAVDYPDLIGGSVNYHFPVAYPERGWAQLVYLLRVRSAVFYDHTIGISRRTGLQRTFNSVGTEWYFDTRWWNQLPVSIGFRYSRLLQPEFVPSGSANRWEIILPVNLLY